MGYYRLFEAESAGVLGDVLGFGAGVFSAIQRSEGVCAAAGFAVFVEIEELADVGQLAALAATGALAGAGAGDGQNRGESPLELGGPGVLLVISHVFKVPLNRLNSFGRRSIPAEAGANKNKMAASFWHFQSLFYVKEKCSSKISGYILGFFGKFLVVDGCFWGKNQVLGVKVGGLGKKGKMFLWNFVEK